MRHLPLIRDALLAALGGSCVGIATFWLIFGSSGQLFECGDHSARAVNVAYFASWVISVFATIMLSRGPWIMRGIALSLALPIYWLLFIPSVVLVAFGQFCDSYSIMG